MRWTFIATASLGAMAVLGQELRTIPHTGDPTALQFNEEFIRRNGIVAIVAQGHVKRDGEPIRPKNERGTWRFDPAGHLIYSDQAYGRAGAGDTSSVVYRYDDRGRLIEHVRNDRSGWFAQRDSLDTAGRALRTTHVRIQGPIGEAGSLPPGVETVISDERFTYATINDTAWRKTWHNDLGLPYREQTFHLDRWGYLRTIEDRNIITGRRGRTTFRYDEKGHLAERVERSDLGDPSTRRYSWRFDATGNITLCDLWHGDRQTKHTEYLYEDGTLLLKAMITKDMETGLIHITRYTTERR